LIWPFSNVREEKICATNARKIGYRYPSQMFVVFSDDEPEIVVADFLVGAEETPR